MKEEYIISREELAEKGLELNDYAINGDLVQPIIYQGLDIVVDRTCELGDQFHSEKSIEDYLSVDDEKRTAEEKQQAFKKAQYKVIWNLIFTAEDNPIDSSIDSILSHQLGCKINGIQKGLYYRHN